MKPKQIAFKIVQTGSQGVFWWRSRIQGRHEKLCLEKLVGLDLVVLPDVFNPALFGSSLFLAKYLLASEEYAETFITPHPSPRPSKGRGNNAQVSVSHPSARVLDLGCGSGLLGLTAAKMGAQVIATDINPEAVRATRLNALLNKLEEQIEVREGNLFEPIANQKFDLILNNPPYYAKEPETKLEQAFFAGSKQEILRKILQGLHQHLNPNGRALLVVSNTIGFEKILAETNLGGLKWQKVAEQRWWAEKQAIYELRTTEQA